jgi:hypothetical protein
VGRVGKGVRMFRGQKFLHWQRSVRCIMTVNQSVVVCHRSKSFRRTCLIRLRKTSRRKAGNLLAWTKKYLMGNVLTAKKIWPACSWFSNWLASVSSDAEKTGFSNGKTPIWFLSRSSKLCISDVISKVWSKLNAKGIVIEFVSSCEAYLAEMHYHRSFPECEVN